MKILPVLTFFLSVSGPSQVLFVDAYIVHITAVSGGSVIFTCMYGEKFCQGDTQNCPDGSNKLLFKYSNDKLLVLMTNLTTKDSGMYYCGWEMTGEVFTFTTFFLKVKEDQCCGHTIKKTVNIGEDTVITCNYPQNNEGDFKYFYKKHDVAIFSQCTSSDSSQQPVKYFIVDDRVDVSSFDVIIRRLTLDDTGIYWCGVGTGEIIDTISLPNVVELHVIDPTYQTTSVSTWDFSTPLQPTETTSQPYGYIIIIPLSVFILAGLICSVIYMRRKNTIMSRHRGTRQQRQDAADYENDPQSGNNDNIHIRSLHQNLNVRNRQPDGVCQSLNPNTIQPDAIYQSLNPNTIQPSVYQSLNQNTTKPDAVYQSLNVRQLTSNC